jgi:hypothetical protein
MQRACDRFRGRHPAASPSWRRGKKSLLIRRDATLAFQMATSLRESATITVLSFMFVSVNNGR